ncbi:MAG: carboxylating nicotinate-nucleotide diphosphorylase [Candidatus Omnitrophota bacterium]
MDKKILKLLRDALDEDRAREDITSRALFPKDTRARAVIVFKQSGIVCGLDIVRQVFKLTDRQLHFKARFEDGDRVKAAAVVARLEGKARAILAAERTAMNFLGHLSGVATLTDKYAAEIRGFKTQIVDTRKTLPNLRLLQKYAVACGGGANHRFDLAQMVLIKDNHKKLLNNSLSIEALVKRARKKAAMKMLEIEVENLQEFYAALNAHPDIIMLDNMKITDIKAAVSHKLRFPEFHNILIEASGNIGIKSIRPIAKAGVDMISIGSLTHSAPAIDVSLEIA